MTAPDSKTPNLTPGVQKFVDDLAAQGGPALYTLTPEQAREVLIKAQSGNTPRPDVEIEDTTLEAGPTGKVNIRICRPCSKQNGSLPLIYYIHGGGWIMGNKETHDRLVRELAVGAGAAVVYPDYTNSPDAQYPVPLEQIYAAYELVLRNAGDFGIDPERVALAGDSAGGNMAIATALLINERNGPKARFLLALYPVTDGAMDSESYKAFADGPWLTAKAMKWFWEAYCPDEKTRTTDPLVSVLKAPDDKLKALPTTLVITDENDVLRDEGEAFALKAAKAGAHATSVRINGTHHDFLMLDGLADTCPTKVGTLIAVAALKKAFCTKK